MDSTNRRRVAGLVSAVVALVLPVGAHAQIPGAHYSGTTDQNFPINFDVSADGTYLTNVVTTVTGSCGQQYSTNSPFAFPIAAVAITGDDPDTFPYLKMRGSFSSPQQASGTLSASNYGLGPPLYCNALGRVWNASTSATAPGGGGGDPGGAAGGTGIAIAFPDGALLKPSLSNGFIVATGVQQPATLKGKLMLSKKLAKKYGLGKKAVVVGTATVKNAGPDSGMGFKFSKAIRKKLKKATSLKFTLEVVATWADGTKTRETQTLSLVAG
jgi:hypothetical protein